MTCSQETIRNTLLDSPYLLLKQENTKHGLIILVYANQTQMFYSLHPKLVVLLSPFLFVLNAPKPCHNSFHLYYIVILSHVLKYENLVVGSNKSF